MRVQDVDFGNRQIAGRYGGGARDWMKNVAIADRGRPNGIGALSTGSHSYNALVSLCEWLHSRFQGLALELLANR